MRKPAVGRVLLVVAALVSRAPLDELGWPNVVVIGAMLCLVAVASCLAADMGTIEGSIGAVILVGFILTAGHAFSGWLDISYVRAFLGACFWTCLAWLLIGLIPIGLDVWDRLTKR